MIESLPGSSSEKTTFSGGFFVINQFSSGTPPQTQALEIEIERIRTHAPVGTQSIQSFHIFFR
jgi:hypothetical protein